MSDAWIVLGHISEAVRQHKADPLFFRRANDAAIASLPVDDEGPWPPLCRSQFSVTGEDSRHGSFRGQRLIFFAGHFNYFINDLSPWLDKFEGLLRRLYWLEAEVLVKGGYTGPSLALRYNVTIDIARQYRLDPPKLPEHWELRASRLQTTDMSIEEARQFIGERRALSPDVL